MKKRIVKENKTERHGRGRRGRWMSVTACGMAVLMLTGGCHGKKPPVGEMMKEEVLTVDAKMAKKKALVVPETYVGTVSAAQQVSIYPTASGKIVDLNVHAGDVVQAGQQLFKIDDESAQLSLRSAQAGLESVQASANQSLGGSNTLKEAQEQQNIDALARAEATAQRTLQDAQDNIERGQRTLQDAKDDRDDAKDDLEDAKEKYELAKDYLEDWEDLQDSEPAFMGKTLSEAAAMTAANTGTTTTTTTTTESSTTTTTTAATGSNALKPSEEHLREAKALLSEVFDDELTAADVTASGVSALESKKDSAKTAYTAKDRAVASAKDSVEDLRRAVEGQQDSETNADASLASAEANRAVTDGQVLADTKRVLDAQIKSSSVGVAQAQYALEQYTSKSPINGVVDTVKIELFDTVGPSTEALIISNKDTLKITFSVPETVRDNLRVGQGVKVLKDKSKYNGLITEVDESIDPNTGLFKVEAAVTGDTGLLNGSTVTVKADSYRDDSGVVIPYDAVYYSNGEPYVYIIDGNVAKKVDVTTGMFDKKHIVISSGIKEGDRVITSWSADLRDGAEVQVRTAPAEGDEGGATPNDGDAAGNDGNDSDMKQDSTKQPPAPPTGEGAPADPDKAPFDAENKGEKPDGKPGEAPAEGEASEGDSGEELTQESTEENPTDEGGKEGE